MLKLAAALALSLTLGAPLMAQDAPVVIELYTSQGCSSCPPADALLQDLAGRPDVLALALHVDYWDYIGWKDTFASPAFTQRQRQYARAAGHRTIYTPQMIIAGEDDVVGYRPMQVADLIDQHRARAVPVTITLTRDQGTLNVTLAPVAGIAPAGPMVVQLIRYVPKQSVAIQRGENAGRTIAYTNVVTELRRIGDWDGAAPLALTAPAAGKAGVAVILQHPDMGPIVAAATLP